MEEIKQENTRGSAEPKATQPAQSGADLLKKNTKKLTEDKTVMVDKDALDKLIKTVESQGETIKMLTEVADKGRILHYNSTQGKKQEGTEVKLSTIMHEGKQKVVVAWRTTENEVFQDPLTMVWKEKQTIEFILEDNTIVSLPFLGLADKLTKIKATVVGRTINDSDGGTTLKVEAENGKTYLIDVQFVN